MMQHVRFNPALFLVAIFLAGSFFTSSKIAEAQTAAPVASAASPSLCDLSQQVDQLATLRNETDSAPVTELKLRQDLLKATIGCALADIDATIATMEALVTHTSDDRIMRAAFLTDLQKARGYYVAQDVAVESLDSIDASRRLAQDIGAWRDQEYLGLHWEATEFVALVRNGDLIRAANSRLNQAKAAIEEVDLEEHERVAPLISEAERSVDTARTEQALATSNLRKQPRRAPEIVLGHSRASLDALRETYNIFFRLSAAVNEAAP